MGTFLNVASLALVAMLFEHPLVLSFTSEFCSKSKTENNSLKQKICCRRIPSHFPLFTRLSMYRAHSVLPSTKSSPSFPALFFPLTFREWHCLKLGKVWSQLTRQVPALFAQKGCLSAKKSFNNFIYHGSVFLNSLTKSPRKTFHLILEEKHTELCGACC